MDENAIRWVDEYESSHERTTLTENQLHIPGLRTFGYHNTPRAVPALHMHYHEHAIEITYVEHGEIIQRAGEIDYTITAGDIFTMPADQVHDTHTRPMGIHTQYWMQIDLSLPEPILLLSQSMSDRLVSELENLGIGKIRLDQRYATETLGRIFSLFCTGIRENIEVGCGMLTCFLFSITRSVPFVLRPQNPINSRLMDVIRKITSEPAEEYVLENLAHEAGMSLSFFKKKFKEETGFGPREYINIKKIGLAKEMLAGSRSVTEISMDLNFSSSNYFATTFRRITGFTPSEYRRIQSNR